MSTGGGQAAGVVPLLNCWPGRQPPCSRPATRSAPHPSPWPRRSPRRSAPQARPAARPPWPSADLRLHPRLRAQRPHLTPASSASRTPPPEPAPARLPALPARQPVPRTSRRRRIRLGRRPRPAVHRQPRHPHRRPAGNPPPRTHDAPLLHPGRAEPGAGAGRPAVTCRSPRHRRPVPDPVRRDLTDRDHEIIRPVRPHRPPRRNQAHLPQVISTEPHLARHRDTRRRSRPRR